MAIWRTVFFSGREAECVRARASELTYLTLMHQ